MIYESIPKMDQEKIVDIIGSNVSSDSEKIVAAYSAVYYQDIDFAVDCVLRILKMENLVDRAGNVAAALMQSRGTSYRADEMIQLIEQKVANNSDLIYTLDELIEFSKMFSDRK